MTSQRAVVLGGRPRRWCRWPGWPPWRRGRTPPSSSAGRGRGRRPAGPAGPRRTPPAPAVAAPRPSRSSVARSTAGRSRAEPSSSSRLPVARLGWYHRGTADHRAQIELRPRERLGEGILERGALVALALVRHGDVAELGHGRRAGGGDEPRPHVDERVADGQELHVTEGHPRALLVEQRELGTRRSA